MDVLINKEKSIKDTKTLFIKMLKILKMNFLKNEKKIFLEKEQKSIDILKNNQYN